MGVVGKNVAFNGIKNDTRWNRGMNKHCTGMKMRIRGNEEKKNEIKKQQD